jgi:hypothetical protein
VEADIIRDMNATLTVRKRTVRNAAVVLSMIAAMATTTVSLGCPLPVSTYHINNTILVQKQTTSKKHKIKIYPGADQDVLFFSARGTSGKVYQLFLFDVAGNLVKQANVQNKQTTVLDNIEKGNYLFEVFSDDERIENGQVIIK